MLLSVPHQFDFAAECTDVVIEGRFALFSLLVHFICQIRDVHTASNTCGPSVWRLLDSMPQTTIMEGQVTGSSIDGHLIFVRLMTDEVGLVKTHFEKALVVGARDES